MGWLWVWRLGRLRNQSNIEKAKRDLDGFDDFAIQKKRKKSKLRKQIENLNGQLEKKGSSSTLLTVCSIELSRERGCTGGNKTVITRMNFIG